MTIAARLPRILDTESRRLFQSEVAEFLSAELSDAVVREHDEAGEFPLTVWRRMGGLGLLGLGAPEAIGGSGGQLGESLLVTIEIASRFPSLAADYILCGMVARMLSDHGSPEQQAWLSGLSDGSRIFAYGITEPSGGTDATRLSTRAVSTSSGWELHGHKLWTSLADLADLIFVLARTDPADPPDRPARGLSLIAVERDQPQLRVERVALAGMRAARTCEVFLDGAAAPDHHLIGQRGHAMAVLRGSLSAERILAAGISLGIARSALDQAVDYACDREAFGRPIGALQALQHRLADCATELSAAMLLAERAVTVYETGAETTALAAMAKLAAAEMAARVVDAGMRVMAASGLAAESRMQMFFRDARLQLFSPVSNEMARNIIGEYLGMPRSY
jgi:acyl-CoA dehydrogenase